MRSLRLPLCGLAASLLFSSAAWALDLDAAKAQGLVGETPSGYIAAVSPTAEATALVADINMRRRDEYLRISQGNGQPLSVVEQLAAQKLLSRVAPGEYFRNASGQWQRR
jgi:uncharacterized protein YdbL (DUF1318 family)